MRKTIVTGLLAVGGLFAAAGDAPAQFVVGSGYAPLNGGYNRGYAMTYPSGYYTPYSYSGVVSPGYTSAYSGVVSPGYYSNYSGVVNPGYYSNYSRAVAADYGMGYSAYATPAGYTTGYTTGYTPYAGYSTYSTGYNTAYGYPSNIYSGSAFSAGYLPSTGLYYGSPYSGTQFTRFGRFR